MRAFSATMASPMETECMLHDNPMVAKKLGDLMPSTTAINVERDVVNTNKAPRPVYASEQQQLPVVPSRLSTPYVSYVASPVVRPQLQHSFRTALPAPAFHLSFRDDEHRDGRPDVAPVCVSTPPSAAHLLSLPTSFTALLPISQHETKALSQIHAWLAAHHYLPSSNGTAAALTEVFPAPRSHCAVRAMTAGEKVLCSAAAAVLRATQDPRAALLSLRFLTAAALSFHLTPVFSRGTFGLGLEDCQRLTSVVLSAQRVMSPFFFAAEVASMLEALMKVADRSGKATQESNTMLSALLSFVSEAHRAQQTAEQQHAILLAEARQSRRHQRTLLVRLLRLLEHSFEHATSDVLPLLCQEAAPFFFDAANQVLEEATKAMVQHRAKPSAVKQALEPTATMPLLSTLKRCLAGHAVTHEGKPAPQATLFVTALVDHDVFKHLLALASAVETAFATAALVSAPGTAFLQSFSTQLSELLLHFAADATTCDAASILVQKVCAQHASQDASTVSTSLAEANRSLTARAEQMDFFSLCASTMGRGVRAVAHAFAQRALTPSALSQVQGSSTEASLTSHAVTSADTHRRSVGVSSSVSTPLTLAQLRRASGPVANLRRRYETLTEDLFSSSSATTCTNAAQAVLLSVTTVTSLVHVVEAMAQAASPCLVEAFFRSGVAAQLTSLLDAVTPVAPAASGCAAAGARAEWEALHKLQHVSNKDLAAAVDAIGKRGAEVSGFDVLCALSLAERAAVKLFLSLATAHPTTFATEMLRLAASIHRTYGINSHSHQATPVADLRDVLIRQVTQVLPGYLSESLSADTVDMLRQVLALLTVFCTEENAAVPSAVKDDSSVLATFHGRKCTAQLLSDHDLLSALAPVLTTPMMQTACQDVPVTVLVLMDAVLTSPRLTSRCRCDLLQHTERLLPSVVSCVDATGWVVNSTSATAASTVASTPAATVCTATGYVRSNANMYMHLYNNMNGTESPEELTLLMSEAECDEKTRQYARMRRSLQMTSLRLLRNWVSAPMVASTDASTCEFPVGKHRAIAAVVAVTPEVQVHSPHQQRPSLTSTGRVSRIRRYGGASGAPTSGAGSTSSSTAPSGFPTPLTSPSAAGSSSATFAFPSTASSVSAPHTGPVTVPAELNYTAPLADCTAFLSFIRSVLDRESLKGILDLSFSEVDKEYAASHHAREEDTVVTTNNHSSDTCEVECVLRASTKSLPQDASAASLSEQEGTMSETSLPPSTESTTATATEATAGTVAGALANSKSHALEAKASTTASRATKDSVVASLIDFTPEEIHPLPHGEKRTYALKLFSETLGFVKAMLVSPHFTFTNTWLSLCVRLTTMYNMLLSRRDGNEKRFMEAARELRHLSADDERASAASVKRQDYLHRVVTLAATEAHLLQELLEGISDYANRVEADVAMHAEVNEPKPHPSQDASGSARITRSSSGEVEREVGVEGSVGHYDAHAQGTGLPCSPASGTGVGVTQSAERTGVLNGSATPQGQPFRARCESRRPAALQLHPTPESTTEATESPSTAPSSTGTRRCAYTETSYAPPPASQRARPAYTPEAVHHCLLDMLAQNIRAAEVEHALQQTDTATARLLHRCSNAIGADTESSHQHLPRRSGDAMTRKDGHRSRWAATVCKAVPANPVVLMSSLLKNIKTGNELPLSNS